MNTCVPSMNQTSIFDDTSYETDALPTKPPRQVKKHCKQQIQLSFKLETNITFVCLTEKCVVEQKDKWKLTFVEVELYALSALLKIFF